MKVYAHTYATSRYKVFHTFQVIHKNPSWPIPKPSRDPGGSTPKRGIFSEWSVTR